MKANRNTFSAHKISFTTAKILQSGLWWFDSMEKLGDSKFEF